MTGLGSYIGISNKSRKKNCLKKYLLFNDSIYEKMKICLLEFLIKKEKNYKNVLVKIDSSFMRILTRRRFSFFQNSLCTT